jgi:hypothetical protein
MASVESIREKLVRAIEARDPDAFELALTSAHQVGLSRDLAGLLAEALLIPWHTRHEDIALALQVLRDPVAVDSLFKAAQSKHEYLEYDEFFGLARKCTWALADIGTVEARRRLEQLARCENRTISAYAQKRLDRWEEETERKGAH